MAHISLIAKGPIKSAKRAASRHGVTISSCRAVRGDVQCYAKCHPKTNRNVAFWYGERSLHAKKGRGYPPGTLLYHGAFCETGMSGSRRRRR